MSQSWPIIAAMLVAGFAVTYVWRVLAVIAVGAADPESEVLLWVRAVATALVAALVMRILFHPTGMLADTHLWTRLTAMAAGIAVFFLARRSAEAGLAAAIVLFVVLQTV